MKERMNIIAWRIREGVARDAKLALLAAKRCKLQPYIENLDMNEICKP